MRCLVTCSRGGGEKYTQTVGFGIGADVIYMYLVPGIDTTLRTG